MDDGGCEDRSNCAASDGMLLGEDTKWDMVVVTKKKPDANFTHCILHKHVKTRLI